MTEYSELVKALRCKRDDCDGCDIAFFDKDEGWMCRYAAKDDDAATAIEALQAEVEELKAKKMKLAENSLRFVGKVRELDKRRFEPKRGEWLPYEFNTNGTWHKCSVCGVAYQYKDAPNSGWWINHNYCPNCGAKMEVQE